MPISGDRATVAPQRRSRAYPVRTASMKEWDMSFWEVVGSIFWFMILFAWIGLLFRIFGDLFGDHELSGWGKALWTVFLIFLPWLGALVYLIARGRSMNERALARAKRSEQAFSQYVRETAGASTSTADELAKLAELRDRGTISDEEFRHAKAKLLGRQPEVVSPAYTGGRPVPSTG
jgi:Short C-terminal domain/Phospholipase_D-nuclease N-terminal